MSAEDFHKKAFDEGTLTKLEIFRLYAREWLPVFLSREQDWLHEVHLFDFFAGPGTDSLGVAGSPLLILEVLREYAERGLAAWGKVGVTAHFFDESKGKIETLKKTLAEPKWQVRGVSAYAEQADFATAFAKSEAILGRHDAAKLLIIDQFGVLHVTPEVFQKLITFPCSDFLFFILLEHVAAISRASCHQT